MTLPAVHIGHIIGHGILFDPHNSGRLHAMDFDELLASMADIVADIQRRITELRGRFGGQGQ